MLKHPWPAIARTIWGDPDRYVETYFGKYGPEIYVAGDGAKRDEDGYFWLLGRIDDVMNVAGHRLSTYEIESALVDDQKVAEAAVVSRAARPRGRGHRGVRDAEGGLVGDDDDAQELREHVAKVIGKIAQPDDIIFTDDLPKTRSGKIMRRLLRDVARGGPLGDVTTLANAEIVEQIRDMAGRRRGRSDRSKGSPLSGRTDGVRWRPRASATSPPRAPTATPARRSDLARARPRPPGVRDRDRTR